MDLKNSDEHVEEYHQRYPDKPGSRNIDREYDWSPHVGPQPTLTDEYWKLMKRDHLAVQAAIR